MLSGPLLGGAALLWAVGCGGAVPSGDSGAAGAGGAEVRAEPGREAVVEALARGYFPGRVGDIAVIPDPAGMITLADSNYGYMHGGPWAHDTRIPLILWGAGVFEAGDYPGAVSHQDAGATVAALLGLPERPETTGRPLRQALAGGAGDAEHAEDAGDGVGGAPGLVAVIVLDAMRADYLGRYADRMPNLTRLAREGARFPEARVDYLPTNTSTAHTTISTGTDPAVHGIVGNTLYERTWGLAVFAYDGGSPRNLMTLTAADRWGVVTEGRAEVLVMGGTDYPAAALAGHGRCMIGGAPAWVAYYDSGTGGWATLEECHRLPEAASGLSMAPLLEEAGGTWMGHELGSFSEARRSALFARFEAESAAALVTASAFGEDEVADLFLANLKGTDYVSHKYGPFSPELEATLEALDAGLGRLVSALEAKAGPRGLALVVTSDHGMADAPTDAELWVTYDEVSAWLNSRVDPGGPGVVAFFGGSENELYLDRERVAVLGLDTAAMVRELELSPVVRFAIPEAEVRRALRRETERARQ